MEATRMSHVDTSPQNGCQEEMEIINKKYTASEILSVLDEDQLIQLIVDLDSQVSSQDVSFQLIRYFDDVKKEYEKEYAAWDALAPGEVLP